MSSITEISKAEYRIAEQVARGFSEKEIADNLCLSEHTVHNHTYNIRKKLNARSAVDICRIFILSLDNPKQFIVWLMFVSIQGHMMISGIPTELRPVKPGTRISLRTTRKTKD